MKKTFLAGLATLLPIVVTLFIVFFVVDLVTAPFVGMIEDMITYYGGVLAETHHYVLLFVSRVVVLVLFIFLIFLLGFLGRRIFFSWIVSLTDRLMKRIPIVKSIYRISRDITANVFSEKKKSLFKGTVAVPFPHEKTLALGLLSGEPPKEVSDKKEEPLKSIFVPTAPHPISGFLVMYSEHEVRALDIETEDLFKFLLSCGIYRPGEKKNDEK